MDITPTVPKDKLIITRYGDGGFVVNDIAHKGNILIGAQVLPWEIKDISALSAQSLSALFSQEMPPEVVIIGTGRLFAPLSATLRAALREKGIVAEGMDSGAACRTYNVLISEDRRVAAALIAI